MCIDIETDIYDKLASAIVIVIAVTAVSSRRVWSVIVSAPSHTWILTSLTFLSCVSCILQVEVQVPQGQPPPHDAFRVCWLHRWM